MKHLDEVFENKERRKAVKSALTGLKRTIHYNYNVKYSFLDKNKNVLSSRSDVCFARITNTYKQIKDYKNRVPEYLKYVLKKKKFSKVDKDWINLLIKNGVIESDINTADSIQSRGFYTRIRKKTGKNDIRIFSELCMLRFIDESPNIVRATVRLVNDANIEFWQAFVYAHKNYIGNVGHSFIGLSHYNAGGWSVDDAKNLATPYNIRGIFRNFKFKDARPPIASIRKGTFTRTSAKTAPKRKFLLKNPDLILSDDIQKVYLSNSREEFLRNLKVIKKEGKNV